MFRCSPLESIGVRATKLLLTSHRLVRTLHTLQADMWYRGKVVQIQEPQLLIHYNGWNRRYDEWHKRDDTTIAAVRFLEAEEAAAAAATAALSATPVVEQAVAKPTLAMIAAAEGCVPARTALDEIVRGCS